MSVMEVASDRQVDGAGRRPARFCHASPRRGARHLRRGVVRRRRATADSALPAPTRSAPPARAAPAPGADQIQFAAREHDLGYRAYLDKQYDEAASHFENAFFAAPNPAELRSAVRARRDARRARARGHPRGHRSAPVPGRRRDEQGGGGRHRAGATARVRGAASLRSAEYSVAIDEKIVAAERVKESRIFVESRGAPASRELVGRPQHADLRSTRRRGAASPSSSNRPRLAPRADARRCPSACARPGACAIVARRDGGCAAACVETLRSGCILRGGWRSRRLAPGLIVWSGIDTVNNPGADAVRRACSAVGYDGNRRLPGRGRRHGAQLRTNIHHRRSTSGVAAATAVVGLFFTQWPSTRGDGWGASAAARRPGSSLRSSGSAQAGLEGTF